MTVTTGGRVSRAPSASSRRHREPRPRGPRRHRRRRTRSARARRTRRRAPRTSSSLRDCVMVFISPRRISILMTSVGDLPILAAKSVTETPRGIMIISMAAGAAAGAGAVLRRPRCGRRRGNRLRRGGGGAASGPRGGAAGGAGALVAGAVAGCGRPSVRARAPAGVAEPFFTSPRSFAALRVLNGRRMVADRPHRAGQHVNGVLRRQPKLLRDLCTLIFAISCPNSQLRPSTLSVVILKILHCLRPPVWLFRRPTAVSQRRARPPPAQRLVDAAGSGQQYPPRPAGVARVHLDAVRTAARIGEAPASAAGAASDAPADRRRRSHPCPGSPRPRMLTKPRAPAAAGPAPPATEGATTAPWPEQPLLAHLLLGELALALDVDPPAGEPGGQPGVLALLADGEGELEVRHDHLAVWVSGSMRTSFTFAGERAFDTKREASSAHGMMSTFSPRSSLTHHRTLDPFGPTQARPGSTLTPARVTAISCCGGGLAGDLLDLDDAVDDLGHLELEQLLDEVWGACARR